MEPTNDWKQYDLSHFRTTTGDDLFDVHDHFARWSNGSRPGGYDLYLQSLSTAPRPQVKMGEDRQSLLNLASYNYLGLSYRPEVIAAATEALGRYGLGAAGSPHLSGLLELHEEFARELADFKGVEAALLFPSGYSANIGAISALVGTNDWVIADMNAHASIVDGCVLAQAKLSLFRHNDMHSLEKRLSGASGRKLVIVEGVYSMDGDIAPLDEVVALCKRHGARVMVDEAHSAFVYGEHGKGLVEHFGVENDVDVHFGTLSKSLGGMGGYVAGSRSMIDYVRAYARSQVFSCALSPPVVGGLHEALRIARREPELRARLWANVAAMREALLAEGVDIGESTSQVIPIMVRQDNGIFPIARELERAGVYLNPILYPAVKRQQSRFRVSISAAHDPADLRNGARIIGRVLREAGVTR
ncbi:MAG: aminotransferase class I/II-fold pyridoxal phosphate-dependent enzyme [Polyangiaceae bacterium]|nr:aminotransferase class I/II-fold pyridoxal phosphate-dependent enzyme [Polyangiaceae bacterium]